MNYSEINAVNHSTLKAMAISPRHYQCALTTPRKDTDAMRLGRLMHAMVFEPTEIDGRWAIWDGGRRAGKEWEAWQVANTGKEIIKAPEDWEAAERVAAAIEQCPAAAGYLREGKSEHTITWTDQRTGVDCKGRVDWITSDSSTIVDLKTCRSVTKRDIQRAIAGMSYHAQAAFYLDGALASRFVWIFVEQHQPHDVVVVRASEDWIAAGRALYQGWLDRLVQCQRAGEWPGVADGEIDVEVPAWALGEDTFQLEDVA